MSQSIWFHLCNLTDLRCSLSEASEFRFFIDACDELLLEWNFYTGLNIFFCLTFFFRILRILIVDVHVMRNDQHTKLIPKVIEPLRDYRLSELFTFDVVVKRSSLCLFLPFDRHYKGYDRIVHDHDVSNYVNSSKYDMTPKHPYVLDDSILRNFRHNSTDFAESYCEDDHRKDASV